ncbi:RICIN domain-containing protein [Dactylosporangium sp. NPDC048998]|uniref:RICIN domain-containing protein n=1 Tax=Dactylosporangium sp. NPDC048998 TaxID=3363976 RepID=UPI003711566E
MPNDRDHNASADWDDAGWDQATFWHRQAETSPTEPPDTTRLNAARHEVVDGQEDGTASRRDSAMPVSGAPADPLISLRAAMRRGFSRARFWERGTSGATRTGSNRIAIAMLVVVVVSVTSVAFAGLPNPTTDSAAGPAAEPPQVEPTAMSDRSQAPPTEATPTPNSASSPSISSPQSPLATSGPGPSARPSKDRPTSIAANGARTTQQFQFSSRVCGKSFGVSSSSAADGAPIVAIGTGGPAARWRLVDAGSGFFNIVNVGTGKALDNPDGSSDLGTQMQQWTIIGNGNYNQQWQFVDVGAGYRLIVNRANGMALDLRDGDTADGTVIQQWTALPDDPNQQWRLVPVS